MDEKNQLNIFELKNGLRVVHQQSRRAVAHCGLFIMAGSRDEREEESGLAHFIEHTLFKGTTHRRAVHILNRLDSVGGDLDAYTTKEYTCIHASFLNEYLDRSLDLISDIVLNSTFPEKELQKEKEVIIDEINAYQDSPIDQIYDDFEGQLFKGHPLGNPILGTKSSVQRLNKEHINNYLKRLYTAPNMVLSCVSKHTSKQIQRKAEKYFSNLSSNNAIKTNHDFDAKQSNHVSVKRHTSQTHIMMGKSLFGNAHPQHVPFLLLNNLLGGPAMNSILNMRIRERYGFTYNIESHYSPYSDAGLFSIYLGTDKSHMEQSVKYINKELKQLREKKLSVNKLHLSKQQFKGQMALARENEGNVMLSSGRSLMYYDQIRPLEWWTKAIDSVTAEEIQTLAEEHLNQKKFDLLIFEGG